MSNCCSPSSAQWRTTTRDLSDPVNPTTPCNPEQSRDAVTLPGGAFHMGDHHGEGYPADGEGPVHEVHLAPFGINVTTVTNAEFGRFIEATGYTTTAERYGVSAVFYAAFQGQRADILRQVPGVPWWLAVKGANWQRPNGPGSTLDGLEDHPVVHVSWDDAVAYCTWAGGRLPTEAEWEYAARGGLQGARYAWGDNLALDGRWNCNIWQGGFPMENTAADGYLTTAPVKTYTPNGYGLWQMAGNVWEWCQDWFDAEYYSRASSINPRGPDTGARRVMRGGSYLCHDSYCNRYRVAARNSNTPDSTSGNTGFRCVFDSP
nr:formylglycine-generating enzyme family protein [Corynebacterium efficiens]